MRETVQNLEFSNNFSWRYVQLLTLNTKLCLSTWKQYASAPESWALEEENSAAFRFCSWRYGIYVNTAFVNLWKRGFYVCIVPPLEMRANHFSLAMQQKADWGCSNNKLCQILLVGYSSQLVKIEICFLLFSAVWIRVLIGSKCHLTLGQIGWVSSLLSLVHLKHFKTNKLLLSLLCL